MGRNKSLFSGGKHSIANKINTVNTSVDTNKKVDTSEKALEERALRRKVVLEVNLKFKVNVLDGKRKKTISFDFTDLVENNTTQKILINQLLVGAALQSKIKSVTSYRNMYKAIRLFIEFLNHPDNLLNSVVYSVSDISSVVCRTYTNYLATYYPKRPINRKHYGVLRRIVHSLQTVYAGENGIGKKFKWPAGPAKNESPNEGYSEETYNELANACIKSIREIIGIQQRCGFIKDNTETLQLKDWNLPNIIYWLNEKIIDKENSEKVESVIKRRVASCKSACTFLSDNEIPVEELIHIYREKGVELTRIGRSPTGHAISQKTKDKKQRNRYFNIAISTMLNEYQKYPYCIEENADAIRFLSAVDDKTRSLYERRLSYLVQRSSIPYLKSELYGQEALYTGIHFIPETIYPFILLIQINTGWNLESVIAISDDVDLHVSRDLIDPDNYVSVGSYKAKTGKLVFSRSNKKNKFGTYRLLKYVESVVKKYKGTTHYHDGILWQCTLPSSSQYKTLTTSDISIRYASKRFLKRHKFRYFEDDVVNHPGIRTTYETMREIMGFSEYDVSEDMGHSDVDTTSNHYASDGSSSRLKDAKIRVIQNEIVNDISDYKCRLSESSYLKELRDSIDQSRDNIEREVKFNEISDDLSLSESQVINLLSPEGQTYIAACSDSSNPTWEGHERLIKNGTVCRYFNKCCECNRAVIFPEALPFVAKRIIDLETLRESINAYQWISSYGVEYDAWKQILADWSNKNEVRDAVKMANSGTVLLPSYMVGA